MAAHEEEHEVRPPCADFPSSPRMGKGVVLTEDDQGASVGEILIEACRRNNTELLTDTIEGKDEAEIAKLLNETTTVMGNHLYHEAASRGNCLSLLSVFCLSYLGTYVY